MKLKSFLLLSILTFITICCYAQPKSSGEKISDATYTDIKGVTFSLYDYLDQGYSLFIDISATWCGPCWRFHQSGVMKELYDLYGPEGTSEKGKIMPIFIEGDPATTLDDLQGKGRRTQGNWVDGKDYHIVDVAQYAEFTSVFFKPGTRNLSFPTFLLVCPDKTVNDSWMGFNPSKNTNFIYTKVASCAPSDIHQLHHEDVWSVYPNPASSYLNLSWSASERQPATLTVMDLTGKVVTSQEVTLMHNQEVQIPIDHLPSGLYFINLYTEGKVWRKKFSKK